MPNERNYSMKGRNLHILRNRCVWWTNTNTNKNIMNNRNDRKEYPWQSALTEENLSTKRGFVFQYPPFSLWETNDQLNTLKSAGRTGLYLHLPFCRSKCPYCYFSILTACDEEFIDNYIDVLEHEIDHTMSHLNIHRKPKITTLYLGGGTPTYLTERQLSLLFEKINKRFNLEGLVEFTIEAEPSTISPAKLNALNTLGANRLSIGVQTLNTDGKVKSGRSHTTEDVIRAVDMVRESNIKNLNIDLICGLPGETENTWSQGIDRLVSLSPEHITIYLLSIRPQTTFYKNNYRLSEDERIKFYLYAQETLLNNNYIQTSVNCFVRQTCYEHIHQSNMWSCEPMLGFGSSAYSFFNNRVYRNTYNVNEYINNVRERGMAIERIYRLNAVEQMTRYIILRFKLLRLERIKFKEKFGLDVLDIFHDTIEALDELQLLKISEKYCELTTKGIIYVDDVCRSFYTFEHRQSLSALEDLKTEKTSLVNDLN